MYIEAALQGKNNFWRYLVSVILFVTAYFIGQLPFTFVVLAKAGLGDEMTEFLKTLDFETIGIHPLAGFALIVISFIFLFFSVIISVVYIHQRPFKSLLTANKRFSFGKMFFAAGVMLLLMIAFELVLYFIHPENYAWNASWRKVVPLALTALFLLPFQTSAEEFLLRGYLTQGFGLLFRYGWIAVVVTSVIFGSLHFQNPEVKEYGLALTMSYYIGFGLLMGVLVLMSDGLELALGVHFIVNFYSFVLLTYPSSAIKTPALFTLEELKPSEMIIGFTVTSLAFLLIVSLRYRWNDWSKLFMKTEIRK